MDNAEASALTEYARAIMRLFFAWKDTTQAFHQAVQATNDNAELQRHLERLVVLRADVAALDVPSGATAIHRALTAALASGQAYFHHLFDDEAEVTIGQYARDYQEELTMFLAEFNRLVGDSSPALQGPHDRN